MLLTVPVKVKKLNELAVLPSRAKPGDAGMDLTAISKAYIDFYTVSYGTGLAIEIPEGFTGLIYPRSSIYKTRMKLANSVGVIDSGYRGELMINFYLPETTPGQEYEIGDRVAQLVIVPNLSTNILEVAELTDTVRGTGGFGSTGK